MSHIQRKSRPLTRDKSGFRDDRLFLIASDDTYAPKQYFEALRIPRVHFFVAETTDVNRAAGRVLDRLLQFDHEPDDELWLVLDTDHFIEGPHLKAFTRALKDAADRGVKVALSRPCFEVWLLLHVAGEDQVNGLSKCPQFVERLREILGTYNKSNIRPERFHGLRQLACERAQRLDESVAGGRIPAGNTTRVYQVFAAIDRSQFTP